MTTSDRTATPARDDLAYRSIVETAEGYIEALVSQGVEFLFLNPGTDTFPVQEALSKYAAEGRSAPQTILCLFEVVALAAAHGYYAATGRPQAVMVHVDVGTQNLGGVLHDAQRGRAAVVITAGRAPYTTQEGVRGTRDSYIHWLQEQLDQHGIVRNYVKWDYELRRPEQVGEAVARAFQIAASDPPGPTYLTLPRELLMTEPGDVPIPEPQRFPPVRIGAGDPAALRETARLLVSAERPVVLTADSGRTPAGFHGLVRLAELLALPVGEWRNRVNFPSDHPLHLGYDTEALVADADVVLVLDHDVPYIPTIARPAAGATVIQIDRDPIKERIPLWSFPVDLPIRADTSQALDLLADAATELLTPADRSRIEARRTTLAARHATQRAEWRKRAQAGHNEPLTVEWVGHCIGELLEQVPGCIVVDELVTSNREVWRQTTVREPGSWFVSGGSGLGWGLGASLGVKLAHPDRPVLALVGDGSFVFGAPVAALWAMQTQQAPVMIVIFNNGCYNATKRPLVGAYPDGYSVGTDNFIGVDLLPAPRYDLLAPVVGAYGERVESPDAVLPALQRGLDQIRAGRTAIIDIQLAHP